MVAELINIATLIWCELSYQMRIHSSHISEQVRIHLKMVLALTNVGSNIYIGRYHWHWAKVKPHNTNTRQNHSQSIWGTTKKNALTLILEDPWQKERFMPIYISQSE